MSSTPCALRRVRRMAPLSCPQYSTSTSWPPSFSMTMVVAGSPGPQHTAAKRRCSTTADSSPSCTCASDSYTAEERALRRDCSG